jgi:hypothetical protein
MLYLALSCFQSRRMRDAALRQFSRIDRACATTSVL